MSELPAVVAGIVVRPGDTLIIGVSRALTDEDCDLMREQFAERMPGLNVAVMEQVTTLAVYRPDATPPAETAG